MLVSAGSKSSKLPQLCAKDLRYQYEKGKAAERLLSFEELVRW